VSPAPAAAARAVKAAPAPTRRSDTGRAQHQQPQRPSLRVVPARRTPARAPFVLLVSAILGAGLVTVLLVNTWLAQGSFTLHALQKQQTALQNQTQALTQEIAAESAPQALAARAAALGMVPAPNPVFKQPDGRVVGVANQAVRPAPPPAPTPSTTPSPTPSVTPSASASGPSPNPKPTPKASTKPSTKPKASASPSTPAKPGTSAPAGGHG